MTNELDFQVYSKLLLGAHTLVIHGVMHNSEVNFVATYSVSPVDHEFTDTEMLLPSEDTELSSSVDCDSFVDAVSAFIKACASELDAEQVAVCS